jgi:hypothetical protein
MIRKRIEVFNLTNTIMYLMGALCLVSGLMAFTINWACGFLAPLSLIAAIHVKRMKDATCPVCYNILASHRTKQCLNCHTSWHKRTKPKWQNPSNVSTMDGYQ